MTAPKRMNRRQAQLELGRALRGHPHGGAVTRVRPKGCWAVSARPIEGRRLHLVQEAFASWYQNTVVYGATAPCGRTLSGAEFHIEPPDFAELCDLCALADFVAPTVYQLLDNEGRVLYVGCTEHLPNRLLSLTTASFWEQVAEVRHEPFSSIEAALQAEFALIRAEQPPHNRQHTTRDKRPWSRAASSRPGGKARRTQPSTTTLIGATR